MGTDQESSTAEDAEDAEQDFYIRERKRRRRHGNQTAK